MTDGTDRLPRLALAWCAAVLLLAAVLRGVFPTADPPWETTVGIVWHDEGAWVHNARNKALWGEWTTDAWNPMYLAPVFAGLEYASFALFGVGTAQARLVSEVMGWLSVAALGLGVSWIAGRRAGLIAAALLATNYVYVMWNRAALMEATMTAFMVIAWAAYAGARRRPSLAAAAGFAAMLAFFTKAAAAAFVAALGIEALCAVVWAREASDRRAAWWTLGGLATAGLVAAMVFVVPYWTEFRFYNWQMSVTRKPSYTLDAFVNRVTWLPIVHDIFTRMWPVTLVGLTAALGLLVRCRQPAERLLGLWLLLGLAELVLHDVGNERRFVFLIPPLVALAALVLGRDGRLLPEEAGALARGRAVFAAPLVFAACYVVAGAIARLPFLYVVRPGVRLAAVVAAGATLAIYAAWPRVAGWLSRPALSSQALVAVVVVILVGDLAQFGQWAAGRTYENVTASRLIGEWLPPGTPVHGKLANGLSLENRIKPVFVGRGFGNYDDRARRPDIRYVLTYVAPRLGYEGSVILDVLAAHPGWRMLKTFDVAETSGGSDRAALIEKLVGREPSLPAGSLRAHD